MQTWRSVVLAIVAFCCRSGCEDLHLSDREDLPWTPATIVWEDDDGSRSLQASEFTEACPSMPKRSLKVCDKCLSNEMCPHNSSTGTYYVCSPMTKRCADPAWNGTEIAARCTENVADYSTWGAMCMLVCQDQMSPYACASKCLNEDFPCNWVDGCSARSGNMKGMTADSPACLRPCQDHNSMLQTELKTIKNMAQHIDTCEQAAAYYGCTNKWGAQILELCPQTCRTGECAWRCGREELPTPGGQQCWQLVERTVDQYTCARAISEGMDCHCKCASAYLALSRAGGGAFRIDMAFGPQNEPTAFNLTAVAKKSFDVSLSGQAMNDDQVTNAWGPRMKLIVKGQDCQYARLIDGMSGLECLAPPAGSSSASTASMCTTPPSTFSPYLHRWTGITINQCGEFEVCHCNKQCDLTKSWMKAGSITVAPPVEVGQVSKALPGCQPVVKPLPVIAGPAGENYLDTVTSLTLKIYGGIEVQHRKSALHAAKQALVFLLKAHSGLLGFEVPTSSDIVVSHARRLIDSGILADGETVIGSSNLRNRRRMADGCADNNTLFQIEAAKANVFLTSCAVALAAEPAMCSDASLAAAVNAGCQKSCSLCPSLTTRTTTEGPTMAPDVQALGTMSFAFEITGRTDWSSTNILARLNQLKQDSVPYVQRLFLELENAGVPSADVPSKLWVTFVSGPTQEEIVEDDSVKKKTDNSSSILFVVLGSAIGGSLCIGVIFVCMGYCCSRRNKGNRKVAPAPVKEVTEVSEGGYRLKKTQIEGEAPEPEPELDCLERLCLRSCNCCLRCYKRCCTKKLKKAKAWAEIDLAEATAADPSELVVGSTVKLFGLSSAHYNGLVGTILSGPNDKGRYEIDLVVANDYQTEEHQTLSFKPSNMRVIPKEDEVMMISPDASPVAKPKPADVNPLNGLKSSYRTAKVGA